MMKTHRLLSACTTAALGLLVAAHELPAQQRPKTPASKLYVSDVSGEALIDTGDAIKDLSKRSVYNAQGTIIETKKPQSEADRAKHYSTMVYSNGTGAFFDADTRVEIRRFVQEPFTPTRTDIEVEPSVSQTQAFVARGIVGLCTSKLVAGSNMTYQTAHASVNIRGRKVVIEARGDVTKVSMLEGDSTVRAGPQDVGGRTLQAGQQAIIRPGPPSQPNIVQIVPIPPQEATQLEEKVSIACMAKKTVYFEVREKTENSDKQNEDPSGAGDGDGGDNQGTSPVTAFDGATDGSNGTPREIVPVEVVPINLPVEFTVSPATIVNPAQTVTPGQAPGP